MKSENLPLSRLQLRAGFLGTLQQLGEQLSSWQRRARERYELAQLDTLTKRDLGLSDSDVWCESSKYRWQA